MKRTILFLLISFKIFAQKDSLQKSILTGSFQADYQKYIDDNSLIYSQLDEKHGLNSYLAIQYQYQKFRAGIRLEGYFPPLLSFPQNLNGKGIANRFINYQSKKLFINLGNFYEQFGSGMTLRATEQRSLGMDTSIDGINVKVTPIKNHQIKLIGGKQRLGFTHAEGTLYGIDLGGELNDEQYFINQHTIISYGVSFLNKNEPYNGILPQIKPNVRVYGIRGGYQRLSYSLTAEWVQKSADAASANQYNTKIGSGLLLTSNLDVENLSLALQFKRISNMDFRSQRGEFQNNALINYIPATTKQHTYRLLTLYPYASQVLGEVGGQLDLLHSLPNGDALSMNLAHLQGLKSNLTNQIYYQDANVEYEKRWSEQWKTNLMLVFLNFNKGQILGGKPEMVKSITAIIDITHKLLKNKALRYEIQHLSTQQDLGNWAFGLIEFSISPHYFFYLSNEINYGNLRFQQPIKHYPNIGAAARYRSHRITINFGKQREGLICVGGICRLTPAYTGFSGGITSSF